MRLRTQLAALLALFAIVPLAAALVPVMRALSRALASEHAARLDGAARALTGSWRASRRRPPPGSATWPGAPRRRPSP